MSQTMNNDVSINASGDSKINECNYHNESNHRNMFHSILLVSSYICDPA